MKFRSIVSAATKILLAAGSPAVIAFILASSAAAQVDPSGPTGQWYLSANHFALSVNISSPSPGVYKGTMMNDRGGTGPT